jgi:hypothetical protein
MTDIIEKLRLAAENNVAVKRAEQVAEAKRAEVLNENRRHALLRSVVEMLNAFAEQVTLEGILERVQAGENRIVFSFTDFLAPVERACRSFFTEAPHRTAWDLMAIPVIVSTETNDLQPVLRQLEQAGFNWTINDGTRYVSDNSELGYDVVFGDPELVIWFSDKYRL